jgi:hypothetical protein
LEEGRGEIVFSDIAAGARRSLRVFYHRPRTAGRDNRIVIAMHGLDRAAAAFRDVFVQAAERHGQLVLVPEFDLEAFPDPFDATAHDLPRMPEAMAQGAHRLERRHWYHEHCAQLAKRLGVAFGWKLEIGPGAGHVDQRIHDDGGAILARER